MWTSQEWGIAFALTKSGLRAKSGGLSLGWLWPLVVPAIQATIYLFLFALVFGRSSPAQISVLVFGLMTFSLMGSTVSSCSTSIVSSGTMLTQVRVRPLVFVLASYLESIWSLRSAVFVALVVPLLTLGTASTNLFVYPLVLFWWLILTWAVGLIFATITTFARDTQVLLPYFMQVLMLTSPVLYTAQVFPAFLQSIAQWNPIAVIFEIFRFSVFQTALPPVLSIAWSAFFTVTLFFVAFTVYRKMSPRMTKVLS